VNSRPFPGGRGACRCPEGRRRWPAEAWMPQRRHLRANAAQDGRSERPATGRGQPRPSQDVARTSGNPCAERDCHGGLCPRTVSGLRPCFRRPFSAVRATRNRPSRRFPIAQTSIGVPRTRRPTAVGCPPASSTSSAFAARPNRGPARALHSRSAGQGPARRAEARAVRRGVSGADFTRAKPSWPSSACEPPVRRKPAPAGRLLSVGCRHRTPGTPAETPRPPEP